MFIFQALSSLYVILAGVSNAFMDLSSENRFIDNKYNKSEGGNNDENKWKQPMEDQVTKLWYYLWLKKPEHKEKFPYSSTGLVAFTDWWHKYQFYMITCFCLAIVFYSPIFSFVALTKIVWLDKVIYMVLDFIWYRTLFSFSFEQVYSRIKKKLEVKKKSNKKN